MFKILSKRSHITTLRATFTFSLKMSKMVNLASFWKKTCGQPELPDRTKLAKSAKSCMIQMRHFGRFSNILQPCKLNITMRHFLVNFEHSIDWLLSFQMPWLRDRAVLQHAQSQHDPCGPWRSQLFSYCATSLIYWCRRFPQVRLYIYAIIIGFL